MPLLSAVVGGMDLFAATVLRHLLGGAIEVESPVL